jgi:hypothetical protein
MRSINASRLALRAALTLVLLAALSAGLDAHGVSGKDAVFLQGLQGQAIGPLMYLGAKHMVTGYLDGFRRFFDVQPNTRAAVLIFGLFHGFGLATKLQDFALAPEGLVANIISFNVGVEIGQFLALTAILIALSYWRTRHGFLRYSFVTNAAVMACGFLLVGFQLAGYFLVTA